MGMLDGKVQPVTKNGLIGYALERYGAEKQDSLESAYQMRNFWKRFEEGD